MEKWWRVAKSGNVMKSGKVVKWQSGELAKWWIGEVVKSGKGMKRCNGVKIGKMVKWHSGEEWQCNEK